MKVFVYINVPVYNTFLFLFTERKLSSIGKYVKTLNFNTVNLFTQHC